MVVNSGHWCDWSLKALSTRIPFILGLISNITAYFHSNLFFLQADYSRSRQNIINLLSLPVSRGGKLDLPLVWICFYPVLGIVNCFCDFENRHNNLSLHQRILKMAPIYYFAAQKTNMYTSSMRSRVSYRFIVYGWTGENATSGRESLFENGEKKVVFKRIRIRVDRAWVAMFLVFCQLSRGVKSCWRRHLQRKFNSLNFVFYCPLVSSVGRAPVFCRT